MKKNLLALLFPALIAACVTPAPAPSWIGQNFDQYVASNGVPTSSYQAQNGSMIYSFKKNCAGTREQEEKLVTVSQMNAIISVTTASSCPVVNNYTPVVNNTPTIQQQQQAAKDARLKQLYNDYGDATTKYVSLLKEWNADSSKLISMMGVGPKSPEQIELEKKVAAQKAELDALYQRQQDDLAEINRLK
ncbi:MAG: hypothetical protein FWF35_03450 [Elusimicrobia bacterium]|nr:hypothetical protein [Elusimicrobiota bacterium]